MKVDALVAEIGSTTTYINAFKIKGNPMFIGQGEAPTTVSEGDVIIGLNNAVDSLKNRLNVPSIEWDEFFATSSAAGGLKMTVHGLVYDMTVRAAKEAALGAGAIVKMITAGKLSEGDLNKIKEVKPNIIFIAGGVDYGDKDTAIFNSKAISSLHLNIPVIFAGNIQCADEVKHIFEEVGIKVYVTENVYPRIDELNVEPARKIIQKVFEENITKAPGMSSVRSIVNQNIIPTPGAVMESAMILYGEIGDVIVIDVGGATTDVHSVTKGSEEIQRISISPEPTAKRTVEGDLGVYVNLENIVEKIGIGKVLKDFADAEELIENKKAIPKTKREMEFIEYLTEEAVKTAVRRHAGTLKYIYGPTGKKTAAEGKDLTNIKWIVGTGGALTRLNKRVEILSEIPKDNAGGKCLYPKENAKVLIDEDYIMASVGALSKKHMEESKIILMHSLGLI